MISRTVRTETVYWPCPHDSYVRESQPIKHLRVVKILALLVDDSTMYLHVHRLPAQSIISNRISIASISHNAQIIALLFIHSLSPECDSFVCSSCSICIIWYFHCFPYLHTSNIHVVYATMHSVIRRSFLVASVKSIFITCLLSYGSMSKYLPDPCYLG